MNIYHVSLGKLKWKKRDWIVHWSKVCTFCIDFVRTDVYWVEDPGRLMKLIMWIYSSSMKSNDERAVTHVCTLYSTEMDKITQTGIIAFHFYRSPLFRPHFVGDMLLHFKYCQAFLQTTIYDHNMMNITINSLYSYRYSLNHFKTK